MLASTLKALLCGWQQSAARGRGSGITATAPVQCGRTRAICAATASARVRCTSLPCSAALCVCAKPHVHPHAAAGTGLVATLCLELAAPPSPACSAALGALTKPHVYPHAAAGTGPAAWHKEVRLQHIKLRPPPFTWPARGGGAALQWGRGARAGGGGTRQLACSLLIGLLLQSAHMLRAAGAAWAHAAGAAHVSGWARWEAEGETGEGCKGLTCFIACETAGVVCTCMLRCARWGGGWRAALWHCDCWEEGGRVG